MDASVPSPDIPSQIRLTGRLPEFSFPHEYPKSFNTLRIMEISRSRTPDASPDSPINALVSDHDLLRQLESLRQSYTAVQSKSSSLEADLILFQRQRDDASNQNANLRKLIDELSSERNSLGGRIHELQISLKGKEEEFDRRIGEELRERDELSKELEIFREKIDELEVEKQEQSRCLMKSTGSILLLKGHLAKIIECLNDVECEKVVIERSDDGMPELERDEELRAFSGEIMAALRLAEEAELKVSEFKEARKKEQKQLENSVVSLTEENRDFSSLLRIALVEKEAVEKSLNRLKGNSEQKRVALLQIAERGLQRVGFGFMMGSASNEHSLESSSVASTTGSNKSDHGSECEEEVVSLASTVEQIMKNLRLEITQLRRSLEESRSDTERLQSLAEKQAQKIEENMLYIKELEDRERVLTQNVEELLIEIKESEAEVARWREACELEVEAGKNEIQEREKVIDILKQELEKTKSRLEISNGKLKLKEELVATAMAAQAAAERSLQLADSRVVGFRDRIEELTKQIEEAESRERGQRKIRRICWPWRALRFRNNANAQVKSVKRMLPEMQALLH